MLSAAASKGIEPISVASAEGKGFYSQASAIALSSDGRRALFASDFARVTNELHGAAINLFLADTEADQVRLVTASTNGAGANASIVNAGMDRSGRWIAFATAADNLAAGDTNEAVDIFLADMTSGKLERLTESVPAAELGAAPELWFSGNGGELFYTTQTTPAIPGSSSLRLHRWSLEGRTNLLVNLSADGGLIHEDELSANLSHDGQRALFLVSTNQDHFLTNSAAGELAGSFRNHLVLRDMSEPGARSVSVELTQPILTNSGRAVVHGGKLSADGKVVVGSATLTNLYLLRWDSETGVSEIIADAPQPSAPFELLVSSNGSSVIFLTTNGIVRWRKAEGEQLLVAAQEPNAGAGIGGLNFSADERHLFFNSHLAALTGEPSGTTRKTFRVDLSTGQSAVIATNSLASSEAEAVFATDDGEWILHDLEGAVWLRDLKAGGGKVVSSERLRSGTGMGNWASGLGRSASNQDGSRVVFHSLASDLVEGDTNRSWDVFLRDRANGITRMLSRSPEAGQASHATHAKLSPDGAHVAFLATGTNWGAELARQHGLFVSGVDGSGLRRVGVVTGVSQNGDRSFVWNAQGSGLLFQGPNDVPGYVVTNGVDFMLNAGFSAGPAALSSDGRYLVARRAGILTRFDRQNEPRTIPQVQGTLVQLAVVPNGEVFAATTAGAILRVTLGNQNVVATFATGVGAPKFEIDPQGTKLVHGVAGQGGVQQLRVRDLLTGSSNTLSIPSGGQNSVFHDWSLSPDGQHLATRVSRAPAGAGSRESRVLLYGLVDGMVRDLGAVAGDNAGGYSLPSFSGDSKTIFFSSGSSGLAPNDDNSAADVFAMVLPDADSDKDGLPDDWEAAFFGGLNFGREDDPDGDGLTNWQEFRAGTNPSSDASVLRARMVMRVADGMTELRWPSVPGKAYRVRAKDDLESPWANLGAVTASATESVFVDVAMPETRRFYRIELAD